jgi:nucleoside-diphosphate-sugar epimerase
MDLKWLDMERLAAVGEPLAGRAVMVTGASGFLGAAVSHVLAALGAHLFVMVRRTSNEWRLSGLAGGERVVADLVEGSLDEILGRIRPEIIFHCAVHGVGADEQDPERIYRTNVQGTFNLLGAAEKSTVRLMVCLGSSSEYGHSPGPMREDQAPRPRTVYGAAKCAATMLCHAAHARGTLRTLTIRPFSVYGPLEHPSRLSASVVAAFRKGQPASIGSGRQRRDWMYVGDVVELCLMAAANDAAQGQVINCGSGRDTTVRDLVEALRAEFTAQTGRPATVDYDRLPDRPDEPARWVADMSFARERLGYQPRTDLRAGAEKTVRFVLEAS